MSSVLGLEEGDAHIIRNAGGVVTDDEIRSLAISQRLLGTKEIILIHHMYPRVPFYKLRPLFRDIRPSLDANNAVIIGVPGA